MDKNPANNNEEMMMDEDIITLLDENGKEFSFYHAATIDYKDEWYIFLQPTERMEEDDIDEDELIIFKLGQDENGEDLFIPVEDEAVLDEVYKKYEEMVAEGCCCDDEDCCDEEGCCDHENCCDEEECCDDEECSCGCGCKKE